MLTCPYKPPTPLPKGARGVIHPPLALRFVASGVFSRTSDTLRVRQRPRHRCVNREDGVALLTGQDADPDAAIGRVRHSEIVSGANADAVDPTADRFRGRVAPLQD